MGEALPWEKRLMHLRLFFKEISVDVVIWWTVVLKGKLIQEPKHLICWSGQWPKSWEGGAEVLSFYEVVSAILGGSWLSIFQACPTGRRPRGRPQNLPEGLYISSDWELLGKQELESITEEKKICLMGKWKKMDGSPVISARLVWRLLRIPWLPWASAVTVKKEERCIDASSKLLTFEGNLMQLLRNLLQFDINTNKLTAS